MTERTTTAKTGDVVYDPYDAEINADPHPTFRRKALFVNRAHTACFDGMTDDESRGLLAYLFEH